MPRYRVTLSDGRVVTLDADTQPSEADVLAALGLPESQTPAQAPDPLSPSVMEGWQTKVARGSKALPAVGGVIGGAAGSPLGLLGVVGGAGVGGALGEAISQLIRHGVGKGAPIDSDAAAQGMAEAADTQTMMELGGRGLASGARLAGRTLYDAALRPTRTLLDQFPDVVKTALKNRLPVGDVVPGVTRKGSEMAVSARQASGRETSRILSDAGNRGGVRFGIRDVVEKPIQALAKQIDNQPEMRADLEQLGKFTRELLEDKAGDLTPIRMKQIKAQAQRAADSVFKAQRSGGVVTSGQSLGANANAAVASGAKTNLETIGGIKESEALTQSLIGAVKAIRQAEARRAPAATHALSLLAGTGGVVGGGGGYKDNTELGLIMYALMRVAASPRTMSRAGILLTRDGIQQTLRLLPYAAEGMYQATRPLESPETQPQEGPPIRPR